MVLGERRDEWIGVWEITNKEKCMSGNPAVSGRSAGRVGCLMDPSLEAILEVIFASLTELTDERVQRAARVKALEKGLKAVATKATQIDRRLAALERMVEN